MLFEANVLNGKVLMTSMDITSQPEKRIVARQMHKAIFGLYEFGPVPSAIYCNTSTNQ